MSGDADSSTEPLENTTDDSSIDPDRTSLIAKARNDDMSLLCLRPERISLSFDRPAPQVSLDFALRHNAETGNIEIKEPDERWVNPGSVLTDSQHAPSTLQRGDVVESINGFDCRADKLLLSDIIDFVDDLVGRITIVVSTESHTGLHQAVAMKPSCNDDDDSEQEHVLGVELRDHKDGLCVKRLLSDSSWFGPMSVINEGDLVIGINASPCLTLTPDDGQQFLELNGRAVPCLSITTIPSTASQRQWTKARRMAVAVSGGTMMGVGAVMMATPLHPVGHAMAIGGGCWLGKEFEAPGRIMKRLNSSTLRRKSSKPAAEGESVEQVNHTNTNS